METTGRRYTIRFWFWMGAYVVTILGGSLLLSGPPRPDAAHLTAAIVPIVPVILAMFETYRRVNAMDELQRRIHVEGLLLSLLGTAAIVLSLGLLQLIAGIPLVAVFWLWVPISVLYGLGVCIGQRRYA